MALYYLDTSALVKYYVLEAGSTWVRDLVDTLITDGQSRANTIFIPDIGIPEAAAAFSVLERTARISRRTRDRVFQACMHHIASGLLSVLPITSADLFAAAILTQAHPLKAYDAVHLAVALRHFRTLAAIELSLSFVSGDRRLLAAASAEGLAVANPFDHVSDDDMPETTAQ